MARIRGWKKDLDYEHVESWDTTKETHAGVPRQTVVIQQDILNGDWRFEVDEARPDRIYQLKTETYPTRESAKKRALQWMKRNI